MQEFIIYFPDHEKCYYMLSKDYLETGEHPFTRDVSLAAIFYSQKEAFKAFEESKNFKTLIEEKPFCKNFKVLEIPSKRCKLEHDEVLVYNSTYNFFEKGDPNELESWEQLAIKELDVKETAQALADALKRDNENPSMYCWDDTIHNGNIRTLLGVIPSQSDKYIVKLPMGHWDTTLHCGRIRVVNSGYRIPVKVDDEIVWVNPRSYLETLNKKGLTKDQLQPVFETDINLQVFWKKVQDLEKYYLPIDMAV